MTPILEIRDLCIRRNQRLVLDIDYLAIEKGTILAVVGPNGAGKSTLLLAQARLLRPERGDILLNGNCVQKEPVTQYRRRLAMVLQDPFLFDTTVFENVATGLRFRGISRQEIDDRVGRWLERLNISHLRDRRAHMLSGGEAQRVSLARALVLEPELLLLDEPFGALDPPTRTRLVAELGDLLREQQITTIYVTHDLNDSLRMADQIAILLNGKLRQYGSAEVIKHFPVDAEVAAFLGNA